MVQRRRCKPGHECYQANAQRSDQHDREGCKSQRNHFVRKMLVDQKKIEAEIKRTLGGS